MLRLTESSIVLYQYRGVYMNVLDVVYYLNFKAGDITISVSETKKLFLNSTTDTLSIIVICRPIIELGAHFKEDQST